MAYVFSSECLVKDSQHGLLSHTILRKYGHQFLLYQNSIILLSLHMFPCRLEKKIRPITELRKEYQYVKAYLDDLDLPVCFSHNDIHPYNVVYDDNTGKVQNSLTVFVFMVTFSS